MKSLVCVLFLFFLTNCSWEASNKPSILVVAVEGLGADFSLCSEADTEWAEGLGALCADGVRFSHAFTPSLMSQSTLVSILTGTYPTENGVWHNGSQFLSEKFETVAEVAVRKGYRTAFFSGGAPIFRKSGLAQGFELFEDNIPVSIKEMYRPVAKNFELFVGWLTDIGLTQPFFSIVYLADMQFPNIVTINEAGQDRALGVESQLREINESFEQLKKLLIRLKKWDNTHIIVTGLNGYDLSPRQRGFHALNLNSESSQVFFVIKPAKKSRDAVINWPIDVNVSLADLGATLYDLIGSAQPHAAQDLVVSSLASSLIKPQVTWERDRFIMTTSAWADWRGIGETKVALRKKNMLYIDGQKPQLFNTLADRFEGQPLSTTELTTQKQIFDFQNLLERQNLPRWSGITETLIEKLLLAHEMNFNAIQSEGFKIRLSHLIEQRKWDKQILGWMARLALYEQDWKMLEQLGREHLYPIWSYVANINLGAMPQWPPDSCWRLLNRQLPIEQKTNSCIDEEFVAFANWVREADANKKAMLEDFFFIQYLRKEIDETISLANLQNGLMWDTALDVPAEPRPVHLALALDQYKNNKNIIEKRLKRKY